MFLILNDLKTIIYISKMAEKTEINGINYIKVSANNMLLDIGYEIIEVEEVPQEVTTEKYKYIDGEFIIDENYVDENLITEYEDRLASLQELNAIQEETICKLEEDITSLEEMVLDVTASLLE